MLTAVVRRFLRGEFRTEGQPEDVKAICEMLTLKTEPAFKHVLCVYPYRRDLRGVGFVPPLGLEYIAAVIEPFARSLDLVDLRKEPGHTTDFLRPETDLVCFSVNWDRDAAFMRDEICSVPPRILYRPWRPARLGRP